jgi:hypothetical protein
MLGVGSSNEFDNRVTGGSCKNTMFSFVSRVYLYVSFGVSVDNVKFVKLISRMISEDISLKPTALVK